MTIPHFIAAPLTALQERDICDAMLLGEMWTARRVRECLAVGMLESCAAADLAVIHDALALLETAPAYDLDGRDLDERR